MAQRPDLHHSQPVRTAEVVEAAAEDRAAQEQRAADERVQTGTRDEWLKRLALALEKKFDEQVRLTREMIASVASFRSASAETTVRTTLKEIKALVEEMRDNSRLTERVLAAICEVRDVNRELRDLIAENIQQSAQIQDLQLEAFRGMRDSLQAIALVVLSKGTNGHAPEGEPT